MFVDDCCKNSSFFLSILLFSIASAKFANCPDLRRNDAKVTCIDSLRGKVNNGSLLFDTAAIINVNLSGPCQLYQQPYLATLFKLDTEGRQEKVIFSCIYINGINNIKKLCRDKGRIKVKYKIERPGDTDAFNFGLELMNVQLNDSGLYQYEALFFTLHDVAVRTITKYFKFNGGEYYVYFYCLSLKVMISGE